MTSTGGPVGSANGDDRRDDGPQDVVRDRVVGSTWQPQGGPEPIPAGGSSSGNRPVEGARKPIMRKSTAVKLGIGAAVVGGGILLFSMGDDDPEYAAVCVDQNTQTRIDDDYCDDDHYHGGYTHFGWYYFGYGYSAPRVGGHVSGGSYTAPNSTYVQGGVPREGGTISKSSVSGGKTTTVRGGFGSSGKGGSS